MLILSIGHNTYNLFLMSMLLKNEVIVVILSLNDLKKKLRRKNCNNCNLP